MAKMLTCDVCYRSNRKEKFSKDGWRETDNPRFPKLVCPRCAQWIKDNWKLVCIMCPPESTFSEAAANTMVQVMITQSDETSYDSV